jgi:D-galactarolactone cycloisomerase
VPVFLFASGFRQLAAKRGTKIMKIAEIKAYPLSYTPGRAFANAIDWNKKRVVTLVKITTDDGLTGWGEGYGPPAGIARIIETHFKEKLVGSDPMRVEYHWQHIQAKKGIPAGAVGGVDTALWDLKARALGVPLYQILGGKFLDEFVPYGSGFPFKEDCPEGLEQLDKDIEKALAGGFKALKMKIGFGKQRDVARITRVKKTVGDAVELMVDANQGYDLMTCLEMAPFLEECRVKWLEEPLPWQSFSGYKELKSKIKTPIAAGEAEVTMQGYTEAITGRVVDVIQADVPACGGLTPARRIAALAFAFHLDFQPHVFGTILGLPAALHLMASLPNYQSWALFPRPVLLEWDLNPNMLADKILKQPIRICNGVVKVPEGPGLGVEIDEAAIAEFLVK